MAGGKYLIVGLGNVGIEYDNTRHNIGFMVLDKLIEGSDTIFNVGRLGSTCSISHRGNKLILLKPSTYMNLSGKAVNYWLQEEGIKIENLLIICDDLALPIGALRLRKSGSDGGHNGLANIAQTLSTTNFSRLRIGIGSEFNRGGQIDYVLGKLSSQEREQLEPVIKKACQAIKDFSFIGVDRAMNICNTKIKNQESKTDDSNHEGN